ncbi:TPA: RHS repeat-associated core domain-containing protein, partial [Candidatus Avacholeplasma faecigallinarum]|nr:RHS repeat-associated core domain-containing protein [Candidatus Avacholeplasma faecigallinarum]
RSYYYDIETNLYYLQSRYYDSQTHRFINMDSIEYLDPENINGLNLFAYCGNNPINRYDPTGHFGIMALLAITVVSMLIGGGVQLVSNAMAGKTGDELWRGVVGAAVGTGINVLVLCLTIHTGGVSLFIAAEAGSIAQTGIDTLETVIRGEEFDLEQTAIDFCLNFVTTLAGNYIGSKIIPINPGWFQPQKFLSVFTKSYGQKILLQTGIGAGLSGIINFFRKNDWSKYNPVIPVPVIPLYPMF